jgi:hypothetical protein
VGTLGLVFKTGKNYRRKIRTVFAVARIVSSSSQFCLVWRAL